MHPNSRVTVLTAFAIAATVMACNKTSPTSPGGALPAILAISPSVPQPSPGAQVIAFAGQGFGANLQLFVTAPDGLTTTVQGTALQAIDATSFQATLVLAETGTYIFTVENGDTGKSPNFSAVVQPAGSVLPVITTVTPGSVTRSAQPTTVLLMGSNFDVSSFVTVVDPNGLVLLVTAQSFTSSSSSSLQFTLTFSVRGNYVMSVTNPSGDISNPVFVSVS